MESRVLDCTAEVDAKRDVVAILEKKIKTVNLQVEQSESMNAFFRREVDGWIADHKVRAEELAAENRDLKDKLFKEKEERLRTPPSDPPPQPGFYPDLHGPGKCVPLRMATDKVE